MGTKKQSNMKTNNTQISSLVTQFVTDIVIANLAVRYDEIANRSYARRSYRIESEMDSIASEVAAHVRIAPEDSERFLVALAKVKRPAVKLELPACEGLEVRNPRTYRPWAEPMFEAVKPQVAAMADWSPSCK